MKRYFFGLLFLLLIASPVSGEEIIEESVTLEPGWNIVSTPKVLNSHTFSAAETAENFDIYVLDASQPTGWATMDTLGQTEFTPLFGYFVHNKTGSSQTLTFNYATELEPNEKLFVREFTVEGWYSIGVANHDYAKSYNANRDDVDNPSQILNVLSGKHDLVVDFTNTVYDVNRKSLALSDPWKAVVPNDLNELNDFRDMKGYAIYITEPGAKYIGLQNDAVPVEVNPAELNFSLDPSNPDSYTIVVDEDDETNDVTLLVYNVAAQNNEVTLNDLWVNLSTGEEAVAAVVDEIKVEINGVEYTGVDSTDGDDATSVDFRFNIDGAVVIAEGESVTVDVKADLNSQSGNYSNGETIKAEVTNELVQATEAEDIDDVAIDGARLNGSALGDTNSLYATGIYVPVDGADTEADTIGDGAGQLGEFTVEFEVIAIGGDFYINSLASLGSTSPASGVSYTIDGPSGFYASVNASLTSTADEDGVSGAFLVNEGETETFTLTVSIDPATAGQYRAGLDSVFYTTNSDGVSATEEYFIVPQQDFRTDFQSIVNS